MISLSHLISTFSTRTGTSVRKEYLRCQLIRHLKKVIRTILKGQSLLTTFPDPVQLATMQAMQQVVLLNRDLFTDLAQIQKDKATGKSFNDAYCREVLSSKEMRTCYDLYVELMFGTGEIRPGELCGRLKQYCCRAQRHGQACKERWEGLRRYVREEMMRELGLATEREDVRQPVGC